MQCEEELGWVQCVGGGVQLCCQVDLVVVVGLDVVVDVFDGCVGVVGCVLLVEEVGVYEWFFGLGFGCCVVNGEFGQWCVGSLCCECWVEGCGGFVVQVIQYLGVGMGCGFGLLDDVLDFIQLFGFELMCGWCVLGVVQVFIVFVGQWVEGKVEGGVQYVVWFRRV